MTLSTKLINERQAENARLQQKHYNSWRERRKRQRQEQKIVKASEIRQLYRDILPTALADAFGLDHTQITEMECKKWSLLRRYGLIYLVDDMCIGINLRSRNKWLIKRFTSTTVSGYIIYYERYNVFSILQSQIPFFNKEGLKAALARIEDSSVYDKCFQDSPRLRQLLSLKVQK